MTNMNCENEIAANILDFPPRKTDTNSLGDAFAGGLPSLEKLFVRMGSRTDWSYRIESAKFQNGYAVVIASLRMGRYVRGGIGLCPADADGSLENAERRALADAVAKFTFRLPEPRETGSDESEVAASRHRFSSGPEAASLRDMISYSQLSRAKSLASGLSVSADGVSDKIFGCCLAELSRDAADELIEILEERAFGPRQFKQAG